MSRPFILEAGGLELIFFRRFLELHLLMLLGARFGDLGLPMGPQWELLLGPKLDFLVVIF